MDRKIIEYAVIEMDYSKRLTRKVQEAIEKGFSPYKEMIVSNDSSGFGRRFLQVVVKYEEVDNG